jgi:hypothetical protein
MLGVLYEYLPREEVLQKARDAEAAAREELRQLEQGRVVFGLKI